MLPRHTPNACSARSTKTSISSTRILSLGSGKAAVLIARLLKGDHMMDSTPVGLMIHLCISKQRRILSINNRVSFQHFTNPKNYTSENQR